jgi:hypothetical protein
VSCRDNSLSASDALRQHWLVGASIVTVPPKADAKFRLEQLSFAVGRGDQTAVPAAQPASRSWEAVGALANAAVIGRSQSVVDVLDERRPQSAPRHSYAGRFDRSAAAAKPIAAISMMAANPHSTGV